MADDEKLEPGDDETSETPAAEAAEGKDAYEGLPRTAEEIAAAGLTIDVPYEGASSDPQPLEYDDLGPERRWGGSSGGASGE